MTRPLLVAALSLCWLLPGCVIHHGDYTLLSTQLVDVTDFDLANAQRVRNVEGEAYTSIILFLPFGELNPTLDAAIDEALDKADGDLMTNVTVTWFFWYIPLIYGREGWRVEGDVVRTRER